MRFFIILTTSLLFISTSSARLDEEPTSAVESEAPAETPVAESTASETTVPDNVDKFCKSGRYYFNEAECQRKNLPAEYCLDSRCGYAICGQHGPNCSNLSGGSNGSGSVDQTHEDGTLPGRGPCGMGVFVAAPIAGNVRSRFGYRKDPFTGKSRLHQGWDYSRPTGTPVYASAPGKVTACGTNGGYGKSVEIKHSNSLTTRYAHLSKISVRCNQQVERGGLVGKVGSTGRSTGPHLHFEVLCNDKQVDPDDYVNRNADVPLPRPRPPQPWDEEDPMDGEEGEDVEAAP